MHLRNSARTAILISLGTALPFLALGQSHKSLQQLSKAPPAALSHSVDLGPVALSEKLHISVSLPFGNADEAQRYADAVSDPSSPLYRHFLTPEQIGKRFGVESSRVQKVADYLKSFGMTTSLVAKSRLAILAEATVGQAQSAFHTTIRNFRTLDAKELKNPTFRSFTTAPSLPVDVAPLVADIDGLENYTRPKPRALTPSQTRQLYQVSTIYGSGKRGQGRTIGISNWDGFRLSYLPTFFSTFALPTPAAGLGSNISVVTIDGGSGAGDNTGEGDLDIQCVLAVAPLCNLVIYDGGAGLISVLTRESEDNLADIITESYGWGPSSTTATAAHNLHLAMTLQGITYMGASGDDGTTIEPYSYPNYDPEVLIVGGTTTSTDTAGNRTSETGWEGSGGGWSTKSASFNVLPSWLKGTTVPKDTPYRIFPDVAMNADPNSGYWIYMGTYWSWGGGTSASSPTFAAGLALVEQQLIATSSLVPDSAGKYRLGRIQDKIYSLDGTGGVFYDVTSGDNGELLSGVESVAKAGWDYVTGWGAINFQSYLNLFPVGPYPTDITVSPNLVLGGTTSTGTVTLVAAAPTGGKTVSLSSSSAAVVVPATVTVLAGQTQATFTATTSPVATQTAATLTATVTGFTPVTTTLTVKTPSHTLGIGTNTPYTGEIWPCTVSLDGPAPVGGLTIAISATNGSVTVPSSVFVAAGATSASFNLVGNTVASPTAVSVTASRSGVSDSTVALTVYPAKLMSLHLTPTAVVGGTDVSGTVTIRPAAPTGGVTVTLVSGNAAVKVPATVLVPAGNTTASFTVTTYGVAAATPVTVKATGLNSAVGYVVTVNPPAVSGLSLSATSIVSGATSTATVTLTGPAPSGWLKLDLSSSAPSVASVPTSVSVAPGATTATFPVVGGNVGTAGTATIGVSLRGTVVAATDITVTPTLVSRVTFAATSVVGGQSLAGTVYLKTPAPTGGVSVALTSGVPGTLAVPASVVVAAGQSSATFTATSSRVTADKTVYVQASLNGSKAGYQVTVQTPTLALTLASATVTAGGSVDCTVTLSAPVSVGLAVSLASSDTTAATVPASVYIAPGTTVVHFTVKSLSSATGKSTTITATLYGKSSSKNLGVQ